MTLNAVVVMDYQNVHLTAHDVFDRHGGKHEALIHPRRFAEVAIQRRNKTQRGRETDTPPPCSRRSSRSANFPTATTTGNRTVDARPKHGSGGSTERPWCCAISSTPSS